MSLGAAIGGGIGAAVGGLLGGPIGAPIGALLGRLVGAAFDGGSSACNDGQDYSHTSDSQDHASTGGYGGDYWCF